MAKLRVPAIPFERLKLSALIIGYLGLAEWADPRPFARSSWARILLFFLAAELVRQVWTWGLEVSTGHVSRSEGLKEQWGRLTARVSTDTKWKVRRFLTVLAGIWMFGWVVDGATSRCSGAAQCALLFPRIVIENVPTIIQVAVYIAIGMVQLFAMFYAMTKVGSWKLVLPGTISVTFDDVWGQDAAKARVVEQVGLLESSEAVEAAGGYMPKGVLLWGPPGTGKTMLAQAAANASTKPLILVPPGAFASTFIGINFLKVWGLFRSIRKIAMRYGGVIVFVDEIDALGNRGGSVEGEVSDQQGCVVFPSAATDVFPVIQAGFSGSNMGTLEAFLAAMDGMDTPRGMLNRVLRFLGLKPLPAPPYKYLMIGATNLPQKLDPALLRAGRFGRKIHLPYPSYEGRLHTFQGYLARIIHAVGDDDLSRIARDLDKGTGAEIQDVVNEALLIAFRDQERLDRSVITPDLIAAIVWRKWGESDGQQEIEEDRWRVAVHEAGHAVVMRHLLGDYMRIFLGSIERRGRVQGMIVPSPTADRPVKPRGMVLASIAVSLGSYVAEELVFGETTNGMGGDGPAATARAREMVRTYMMGGVLQVHDAPGSFGAEAYDAKVEGVLREAYELARVTLVSRVAEIEAVAYKLLEAGTVLGSELESVMAA